MYSIIEQKVLDHTITKVRELFAKYPCPGHGFDHAEVVAMFAKEIATKEKATNIFICELAGYLHDIGRTAEHYDLGYSSGKYESGEKGHHELSYLMLRDWFKSDSILEKNLTSAQKNELLYSVRNHWNNLADQYDTAWILRDADKLDLFGERGLKRQLDYNAPDETKISRSLRYCFDSYHWIKTKAAKEIVQKNNMLEPVEKYCIEFLQARVNNVHDYE